MGKQGKLTKDLMQSTMPVDSPAYHEKPFIYKGASIAPLITPPYPEPITMASYSLGLYSTIGIPSTS